MIVNIPVMLSLFLFVICLISTGIWYLLAYRDRSLAAKARSRNVRYASVPNAFVVALRKQKFEELKHAVIQRAGKVFAFEMFNSLAIMVAEPELIQLILSKEFTNFTNRRKMMGDDPFLGSMLTIATDDKWKRLRSIITPTFSAGKLKRVKPSIDETTAILMVNFEKRRQLDSENVNIKELLSAFTMDTIVKVSFGIRVDSLSNPDNPIIVNAKKMVTGDFNFKLLFQSFMMVVFPKLSAKLGIRFVNDVFIYFEKVAKEVIQEKKAELGRNPGHQKANNFLELLLEAEAEASEENVEEKKSSKFMTTQELVSQCVMFFLAGFDTTATTITLATYLLALNPDAQQKLYDEITTMLARLKSESDSGEDDPIRLVTVESLSRFEYLNGVISETLRIYDPATFVERRAGKDITLATPDGRHRIHLKKDDMIHIPVWSVHRDPEHWPEPESFRPERFIGEATYHKYAYLPFGSGPRNCVARSLALLINKLALLHLVREYHFRPGPNTTIPVEFFNQTGFLSPKDIFLRVERR